MGRNVTTQTDVVNFIDTITSEEVWDVLAIALEQRAQQMGQDRAAAAVIGADVEIRGVEPMFLNGLRGTIEDIDGDHTVAVRLTTQSTGRLRFKREPQYPVGAEMNYLLGDVPASCCERVALLATA